MAMKVNVLNFESTKCPAFALPSAAGSCRYPKFFVASALPSRSKVKHSMPPHKIEILKSIEGWAHDNILVDLKPVEKCWQPQDFLPDPSSDGFHDQVKELRERAKEIPDDYFVILVGNMITEEALPTYLTMLNTMDGMRDETGTDATPWAIWARAWTAEGWQSRRQRSRSAGYTTHKCNSEFCQFFSTL